MISSDTASAIATIALPSTRGSPRIDPVAMAYWCDYLQAVARMETRGIPATGDRRLVLNHREAIAEHLDGQGQRDLADLQGRNLSAGHSWPIAASGHRLALAEEFDHRPIVSVD